MSIFSRPIINLKECSLFLLDRSGSNFLELRIGEGNLTYEVKKDITPKKARGKLNTARENEEQEMQFNYQFVWDQMTSSGSEPPTMEEVITGVAPGWVSVSTDPNAPFCLNLQILWRHTCQQPNGVIFQAGESITLVECYHTDLNHSVKDATVDAKGWSNRSYPTIQRLT